MIIGSITLLYESTCLYPFLLAGMASAQSNLRCLTLKELCACTSSLSP
uniref:Uncharacterized protein n=1 Tax=Arundo donax TaxID=35708 RepID=A0A0A9G1V7_ARUDO